MELKSPKPAFEVIHPSFGNSFSYTLYTQKKNNKAKLWHYHPEIELVYVNGGAGKRQIGSHISYYTEGDLILIGSNLPHCGFTNELTGNKSETVIQMRPNFLGNDFLKIPEMKNIQTLFDRARGGIAFYGDTKTEIGKKIEQMSMQSQFNRLLTMLSVLHELQDSREYKVLNADSFSLETDIQDNQRINTVFNFVKDNYQRALSLDEVAALVNMTVPSFCRYFKKISNKTFTKFVNEYRLVHASKLLAEKPMSITEICFECGFNNFSHFNKSFREFTGKSPSEYRHEHQSVFQ
ncbi:AraC family transcriptional regulator [Sinomicrobium soli]|uniref:AraC family transcriptional regulator n=1 Tax=Sinomicrobium sp. N-1-3-6 TaxID=2219864 RepID=UPI000DCC0D1C|nr:AraC family transcriptional regulator [Sinomicrobium sp. N-1-3-6]RAV27504.1 AraC family transcriptional regulator [Sinomicrobium sp. N-1-3-6]